jgi:hypothetical protein
MVLSYWNISKLAISLEQFGIRQRPAKYHKRHAYLQMTTDPCSLSRLHLVLIPLALVCFYGLLFHNFLLRVSPFRTWSASLWGG